MQFESKFLAILPVSRTYMTLSNAHSVVLITKNCLKYVRSENDWLQNGHLRIIINVIYLRK